MKIATLDEAMRYAEALSGAGMIPDKFKRQPANVLVAHEIAQTMGESTWVVMSELYFVGAVPTFSAKYMRSRVRQAGHKLRETFDHETKTAKAVIIRADDPDFEHVAVWDEAKARAHGIWDKGHWKKNPELMMKNRAVSEVIREACYEVMAGIAYSTDEARDFVKMDSRRMDDSANAPQEPRPQVAQQDKPVEYWNGGNATQRTREEWVKAFSEQLVQAEKDLDAEKLSKLGEYVEKHSDGELVRMAQQTINRMSVGGEVYEAEVVEPAEPAEAA
ncbi:hypothetical protein cgR_p0026 (plasmid) [Corynebacterium glutamicum R]|uniref:Uncharacterized protein n=2 Tax=Corynebacterium glutamicum TaxID=1718 RepID=A0AB72VF85_CORGB|nr:hypothetical protein cgR_p0026 [Corynebacterium glutamicum R]